VTSSGKQWQAVASSGKQWQTVASVKEGDKAMEIGMNEVLIQSGSQIDVYSFGQGSSRNENFCTWPLDWGSFTTPYQYLSSIRLL